MVGRGLGFRGWVESDGVGVGVGVWAGTVVVGVGLATGRWEEDDGVGLMGGSSGIMSIGVAVLGLVSCGRELEFSQAGPRRGRELRVGGAGGNSRCSSTQCGGNGGSGCRMFGGSRMSILRGGAYTGFWS